MPKIVIFAPYFPPAYLGGGPIRTLSAMVGNAPKTFQCFILTRDIDLGRKSSLDVSRNEWVGYGSNFVFYCSSRLSSVVRSFQEVRRERPDIVYLSSFFDLRFSIVPQILFMIGYYRPKILCLAPRGEFGESALGFKGLKKRLYLTCHQALGMSRRIVWHASSEREASDIRRTVGLSASVIVRENDTALPNLAISTFPETAPELKVAFVGRIVPIKGLKLLLEALRLCRSRVCLEVFGPTEDESYFVECRRMASDLPKNIRTRFHGPLPNEALRSSLAAIDVMAFPTQGENFGHVVAESLSVSCPVICADVTPWTDILADGAGYVVPNRSPRAWANAIERFAQLSPEEKRLSRLAAARGYNAWRSRPSKNHIFTLLWNKSVSHAVPCADGGCEPSSE